MRASLDTLVENALRYTVTGDVIRVTGYRDAATVTIGVADSGAGLSPDQVAAINGTGDAHGAPEGRAVPDRARPRARPGRGRGPRWPSGGGRRAGGRGPDAPAAAAGHPGGAGAGRGAPTGPTSGCQARPAPPPVARSSCTPDGTPPYGAAPVRSANTARTPGRLRSQPASAMSGRRSSSQPSDATSGAEHQAGDDVPRVVRRDVHPGERHEQRGGGGHQAEPAGDQQQARGDRTGHDGVVGGEGEVLGRVGQAQQRGVGGVRAGLGEEAAHRLVDRDGEQHAQRRPSRRREVRGRCGGVRRARRASSSSANSTTPYVA